MKQKIWLKIKINNKDPNRIIRSLNKVEDIDRIDLLKRIIDDKNKIINDLYEEIECLNTRIATLKSRNEEQENIINRFKEENRKIQTVLEANHIHNIPPIRFPKK